MGFIENEGTADKIDYSIEDFIMSETETWLDVAFIQAAIGKNSMATIGEVSQTAELFLGENSRVAKRLLQYGQRDPYEALRAGVFFSFGALMIALEAVADVLASRLGTKLNLYETIVVAILAILYTAMAFGVMEKGARHFNKPSTGSQRGLKLRYNKMEVPAEAKEFVKTALSAERQIKRLQHEKDQDKQLFISQEAASLIDKAKRLLEAHEATFSQNVYAENARKRTKVRIEEFDESYADRKTVGENPEKESDEIAREQAAEEELKAEQEGEGNKTASAARLRP